MAGLIVVTAGGPGASTELIVGAGRSVELRGSPRTAALRDRVAAELGAAVDAVEEFWGEDWSRRIVVVATDTAAEFAAAAGAPVAADTAAVTVADTVDPERAQAQGQRIILAPAAATMNDDALRIVVGHELFHYASRAVTALDAPRWLTEGVADYVARPATALPAGVTVAMPSDAELDATGRARADAYDRAWWFARFVADDYGSQRLRELYLVACGFGHPAPAEAVRRVLHTELPDLLARWQEWAASRAG